jgi:precorrin-6B methylase 2
MYKSFLDNSNKAKSILHFEAGNLRELAHCLFVTGNQQMADVLSDVANELDEAKELVAACVNDAMSDLLEQSKQGAANILDATLAGIKVARSLEAQDDEEK